MTLPINSLNNKTVKERQPKVIIMDNQSLETVYLSPKLFTIDYENRIISCKENYIFFDFRNQCGWEFNCPGYHCAFRVGYGSHIITGSFSHIRTNEIVTSVEEIARFENSCGYSYIETGGSAEIHTLNTAKIVVPFHENKLYITKDPNYDPSKLYDNFWRLGKNTKIWAIDSETNFATSKKTIEQGEIISVGYDGGYGYFKSPLIKIPV